VVTSMRGARGNSTEGTTQRISGRRVPPLPAALPPPLSEIPRAPPIHVYPHSSPCPLLIYETLLPWSRSVNCRGLGGRGRWRRGMVPAASHMPRPRPCFPGCTEEEAQRLRLCRRREKKPDLGSGGVVLNMVGQSQIWPLRRGTAAGGERGVVRSTSGC
jgi:hypothetical protein